VSLPLNQVVLGDCVEVMAGWPENSIDTIVTDPPYGLRFMGKEWDKALPPVEAFEQMIRVLKPGGLAFVMSSPRQDLMWRMCALLEGVGFEMRQSFLSWIYKTGFPKAYDVSKGIDTRNKRTAQDYRDLGEFIKNRRIELGLVQKDISKHFPSKTGGLTGVVSNWENGSCIPNDEQWDIIKDILKIKENPYDKLIERVEADREVIGYDGRTANNSIFNLGIQEKWALTKPNLPEAKQWDGWKSQTGLKPALEPILMVNKPFSESTIVDNVLRWGTGAINVDACRIPIEKGDNSAHYGGLHETPAGYSGGFSEGYRTKEKEGRFPANLLVSDGALDTGEITKSGDLKPHHNLSQDGEGYMKRNVYGKLKRQTETYNGDSGDQSRYFDLDAWAQHHGFLDVPKPSKAERDFGLTSQPLRVPKSKFNLNDGSKDMRFDGVIPTPRRNIHPTCKPVKLMAYLIELGCPPGGIVLDPFVGSGTTCIAAKRLRRQWIGIEIDPEYAAIAEARINIKGPLDQFMEVNDVH